jgi:hypothetical protein
MRWGWGVDRMEKGEGRREEKSRKPIERAEIR